MNRETFKSPRRALYVQVEATPASREPVSRHAVPSRPGHFSPVGIEPRRAHTVITDKVTFSRPPLQARKVGFPDSGFDLGNFPERPSRNGSGLSVRSHAPNTLRFTSQLVLKIMAPPTFVVDHARPPSAQSSFACHKCYLGQGGVQHHLEERYLFFLALASSCAKPASSSGLRVPHLSPEVFAGCCEPLLETGSSRRYLCKSFPGCLSHDPVGLQGAPACCFPYIYGLPQEAGMGRLPRVFPQRDFMRVLFRDRRYFLRSGLLACSPPRSPLPLRLKSSQDSRDFYTRAEHASLPLHASGMLAVRNRQLTAEGLSPS